jgi:hypothetical protein
VRQILNIQDLATFQRFVQLCAGRIGQLLNITSLAADTGITRITAESWLSVLQASHLVFLVRPWFSNLNKRFIKTVETIASDFFGGLDYWRAKLTRQSLTPWLIHGGTARQARDKATVLPWTGLSPLLNQIT